MGDFPGNHHLQLAPVTRSAPLLAGRALRRVLRALRGLLTATPSPTLACVRLLVLGRARRLTLARLSVSNAPALPRCLCARGARAVTRVLVQAISGFFEIATQLLAERLQRLVTQRLQSLIIQLPKIFVAD
jgi:hypothetical protein